MAEKNHKFCPACKIRKLSLKQINLSTAVYLCRDRMCSYPEGFGWTLVPRTLQDMLRAKKKRKRKVKPQIDMDPILDQACSILPTSSPLDDISFNLDHLIEDEISKMQDNSMIDLEDFDSIMANFDCNNSLVNLNGSLFENILTDTVNSDKPGGVLNGVLDKSTDVADKSLNQLIADGVLDNSIDVADKSVNELVEGGDVGTGGLVDVGFLNGVLDNSTNVADKSVNQLIADGVLDNSIDVADKSVNQLVAGGDVGTGGLVDVSFLNGVLDNSTNVADKSVNQLIADGVLDNSIDVADKSVNQLVAGGDVSTGGLLDVSCLNGVLDNSTNVADKSVNQLIADGVLDNSTDVVNKSVNELVADGVVGTGGLLDVSFLNEVLDNSTDVADKSVN